MTNIVLAIDTATPAVTAGLVRRDGDSIDVLAERVTVDARAHAEQLTPNVLRRARRCRDRGDRPRRGRRGLRPRAVHRSAGRHGHRRGVRPGAGHPVYGVCSLDAIGIDTAGEVLVVTDARRREVYWARYRDGVRIDGPAVNAPADVTHGRGARCRFARARGLFGLPRQPAVYPTAGLVRVVDWSAPPQPLVPLYLRRPMPNHRLVAPMTVPTTGWRRSTPHVAPNWKRSFRRRRPVAGGRFPARTRRQHIHYVAARADDKLVGYAGIARLGRKPPYEYEIHTIGVDPAYQGQGIGRRLLNRLLDFAADDPVYLEVRTDNAAAIAMYEASASSMSVCASATTG